MSVSLSDAKRHELDNEGHRYSKQHPCAKVMGVFSSRPVESPDESYNIRIGWGQTGHSAARRY